MKYSEKPAAGDQDGSIEKTAKEQAEDFLQLLGKERLRESAALTATVNKSRLEDAANEAPDGQERALLELFSKLPEKLDFKPGITIIIGENGSGKSTLAKAFYLSILKKQKAIYRKKEGAEAILDDSRVHSEIARWFASSDEMAENEVFNPKKPQDLVFIRQSGLAPILSHSLSLDDCHSMAEVRYGDFQELVGLIKEQNSSLVKDEFQSSGHTYVDNEGREAYMRLSVSEKEQYERKAKESIKSRTKRYGSSRQTVDQLAKPMIHGVVEWPENEGPSVFFLDEPESGLSPFRHKDLEKEIDKIIEQEKYPNSISLVPTNSTVLYQSDLPRIDLRFPDRGIFRPSEYPGYFD